MSRSDVRLVILDEPFRGLDRGRRAELLKRARHWWRDATLICITHDMSQTVNFERVLVIDGGQIVEDGAPGALRAREGSRYGALAAAEDEVRSKLWSGANWKRIVISSGRLTVHDGDPVRPPEGRG